MLFRCAVVREKGRKRDGKIVSKLYKQRDLWYNTYTMEKQAEKGYTLITGATGGLGRAFAKICAQSGDLVLTGRNEEKLRALRQELLKSDPGRDIRVLKCDLADAADRKNLFEEIKGANLRFVRLINVAGADIQKTFEKYTQEKIVLQCRVNLEAAVSVSKFVLENRASGLEIITISSISGVYPMPYFALYSATKSAVSSFFSSLRIEMKGRGVKVTAVEPGGIYTRPDICESIRGQGLWGRLSAKSPEYVARKSLKAVRKNRRICRPGFWNKFIAVVPKILPLSLRMRFISRRWSKLEKDAF